MEACLPFDGKYDAGSNPSHRSRFLAVMSESTSLARPGWEGPKVDSTKTVEKREDKEWKRGLEEGELTARLPWSCRPTRRILRLPSSPLAS